ncbi:MAG: thioesterase domain-containing protein, partial [Armatimonadota bacterium]|nr:thioesterase domain-containing protein [Armatimonadota bacterium]
EFLGRRDNQVKIRGFRIELGEIESALLRLPNVKEAVIIVQGHIPGQKSLAAYVVPGDPNSPCSTPVLREALAAHLPGYMVPASFTALPALPLTPNGKIDRKALPAPALDTSEAHLDFAAPADEIEARILALWEELLPGRVIGVRDSFFEIGGHSLLAVRMMHRLEQLTAQKIPLAALFEEATIAHLAAVVRGGPRPDAVPEPMVAFHTGGAKTPLFFLHGDFGGGFYCTDLANNLGADQPLYTLPPHGIEGSPVPGTIEEMASEYLALIRRVRPQGPYLLGGYCNGALIAFEIAQQLLAQGEAVDALVLMEVDAPVARFKIGLHGLVKRTGRRLGLSARVQRRSASGLQQASIPLWLALKKMRGGAEKATRVLLRKQGPDWAAIMPETYRKAPAWYTFRPYPGRITLLQAGESRLGVAQRELANWREIAQSVEIHHVPGNHGTCLTVHNASLAAQIRAALEQSASD